MLRALTVFSVLLLAPVVIVTVYSYFDFNFRLGEAAPSTINTLLTIHGGCALAAFVWLGVVAWLARGRIVNDLGSKLGIICVMLTVVSVAAWAYCLFRILVAGMWYDLP